MTRQLVVIGDSRKLEEVDDSSVQLVVTSPPYWNLKNYGDKGLGPAQAYGAYIQSIAEVLAEFKRVVEPGRFVCLNVGTAVSNDRMESIPSDILPHMRRLGFTFKKEIVWMKPLGTQGLWQRGVTKFLKNEPYPGRLSLNIMHEYILIFQKEGVSRLVLSERDRLSEEFIKKVSWSVWTLPVSRTKGHPAPFPEELPERLIRLYTVEGETVLDPFGGTGTTMRAAKKLNRSCTLYEINPDYLPLLKQNVGWMDQGLDLQHSYELRTQATRQVVIGAE